MRAGMTSLLLVPLLAACGTISHGPMQQIRVNSDPMGALVRTEGCGNDAVFKTPGKFYASRKSDHCRVRILADGYEAATVTLQRQLSKDGDPDFELGEVDGFSEMLVATTVYLVVGLVSIGVDFASGGAYELYPSRISIDLQPSPDDEPPPFDVDESGTTGATGTAGAHSP